MITILMRYWHTYTAEIEYIAEYTLILLHSFIINEWIYFKNIFGDHFIRYMYYVPALTGLFKKSGLIPKNICMYATFYFYYTLYYKLDLTAPGSPVWPWAQVTICAELCMFSKCLCGFPLGSSVSSHLYWLL